MWRLPDKDFLEAFRLPAHPDVLATRNPVARESRITFDENSHVYTFDGNVVPRSVTGLLKSFTSPFDPAEAIAAMKRGQDWERKDQFMINGVMMSDDARSFS